MTYYDAAASAIIRTWSLVSSVCSHQHALQGKDPHQTDWQLPSSASTSGIDKSVGIPRTEPPPVR